jgi:hypothetical protein
MKRTFAVLTVLLMLPLTGMIALARQEDQPQRPPSLAEVARQQRARRQQQLRSGETITTEVAAAVRPGSKLSITGVRTPEASPSDTTTPEGEAPASGTPPAGNSEEAWRARFDDARANINRIENLLQLHDEELTELNNQLLTRSDIYNREGQLTPMITAKQDEIAQTRQALVEANQALQQLQTELRQAGLPAGWAR